MRGAKRHRYQAAALEIHSAHTQAHMDHSHIEKAAVLVSLHNAEECLMGGPPREGRKTKQCDETMRARFLCLITQKLESLTRHRVRCYFDNHNFCDEEGRREKEEEKKTKKKTQHGGCVLSVSPFHNVSQKCFCCCCCCCTSASSFSD